MVLVPREPTEAMLEAGMTAPWLGRSDDTVRFAYRAIIAAAPPATERDDAGVHLAHCNQGEYCGSCKYGEDQSCPALAPAAPPALCPRTLEAAAKAIRDKHTNNRGIVHPMALDDSATILALGKDDRNGL